LQVTLEEAVSHPKRVDLESDAIRTARSLDICLGD
jgi:hypothetical protein